MSRRAREMRKILYPLKRERGEPVQIHRIDDNSVNLETGAITKSYNTNKIAKAIVLPIDLARKFIYDLAYIAANKNFTAGGLFDKATTMVIIDRRELPTGVEVDLDDYCSISGVTYKVASSVLFEGAFYILQLTTITNFQSLEV